MQQSGRSRLSGWKEIASHLDVTVRTAQLWEKQRGLPVRRSPGEGRSRVFAYVDELEAWLLGSLDGREGLWSESAEAASAGAGGHEEGEAGAPRSAGQRALSTLQQRVGLPAIALALGSLAIVLIAFAALASGFAQPEPAACQADVDLLRVFGRDNELLWERRLRYVPAGQPIERFANCEVLDADGDGRLEVLAAAPAPTRLASNGLVYLFDERGRLRWTHEPGLDLSGFDPRLRRAYMTSKMRAVDVGGRRLLVISSRHEPWYPSVVELLEPEQGEVVDRYLHPGHVYSLAFAELDSDDDPELLVGVTNNPGPGPGVPALVLLDLPFSARGRTKNFFGIEGPHEIAYYVFPPTPLDAPTGSRAQVSEIGVPEGALANVMVSHTGVEGLVAYVLDLSEPRAPVLRSMSAHVQFRAAYERMRSVGGVDAPPVDVLFAEWPGPLVLEKAPNGNSPELWARMREMTSELFALKLQKP